MPDSLLVLAARRTFLVLGLKLILELEDAVHDVVQFRCDLVGLFLRDVVEFPCNECLREEFCRRPTCNSEEVIELTVMISCCSFGDVARNRNTSALHLAR